MAHLKCMISPRIHPKTIFCVKCVSKSTIMKLDTYIMQRIYISQMSNMSCERNPFLYSVQAQLVKLTQIVSCGLPFLGLYGSTPYTQESTPRLFYGVLVALFVLKQCNKLLFSTTHDPRYILFHQFYITHLLLQKISTSFT